MSDLLRPALVVMLKHLPVTMSLIVDSQLTTPIGIEDLVVNDLPKVMVRGVDLLKELQTSYPDELQLLTAISQLCDKSFLYLLQEGELRIFTEANFPVGLKRIMDALRERGASSELKERLMDMLSAKDESEWLDTEFEEISVVIADGMITEIPKLEIPVAEDYQPATYEIFAQSTNNFANQFVSPDSAPSKSSFVPILSALGSITATPSTTSPSTTAAPEATFVPILASVQQASTTVKPTIPITTPTTTTSETTPVEELSLVAQTVLSSIIAKTIPTKPTIQIPSIIDLFKNDI